MTLDEKLSEMGIKKILVADDRLEHIEAAKAYFGQFTQVQVDYAYSEIIAKAMIHDEYTHKKYDLVISDMQMEEITSGRKVVAEASKHQALGIVVTYRGAGSHGAKVWGEGTTMIAPHIQKEISFPKRDPEAWKTITQETVEYLQGKGQSTFDALKRIAKYVGKPSDTLSELMMHSYDFEIKGEEK